MQARKSTAELSLPRPPLPPAESEDARECLAARSAVRPSAPQAPSERLAGPFRVKPSSSYLERRAWPFCGQ